MRNNFQATLWALAAAAGILTALFALLSQNSLCLTLAISFGTTFYHFAMRLTVGWLGRILFPEGGENAAWFREKSWERPLYRRLRVRQWKKYMPTYNPTSYFVDKNTDFELMADNTCRNEVIHWVIAVLSYVPLLFSIWLGEFWVFLITSIISSAFDMIFVIMQRYNRPRLIAFFTRHKG